MACPKKLSLLLFREGDWWVTQCLELDIASQGKGTMEDAIEEFWYTFIGQLKAAKNEGVDPFDLPKAPANYWDAFDKATELHPKVDMEQLLDNALASFRPEQEIRLCA